MKLHHAIQLLGQKWQNNWSETHAGGGAYVYMHSASRAIIFLGAEQALAISERRCGVRE